LNDFIDQQIEKFEIKDQDTIFQFSKSGISKMLRKLVALSCDQVNLNITAHSFRRSFATFHSRRKPPTPINTIRILMGHKSISTT